VLQKHGRHTCVASGRTIATPSRISCAVSILLSHHWPSTCLRVVRCLARAHTCGNESSRPPVEHSRSHSRMCRFNSARTSRSCNSVAFPPATCCDAIRAGLPPSPVLHCASNPRRVAPALTVLLLRSCSLRVHRAITTAFVSPLLLPSSSHHNRLSAPLLLCVCFCCTHTSTYLVLLTEPRLLWTPEHFTQMNTPLLADAHLELGALQSAQMRFALLCNNSFSLS
jgi:hypothetical protein